MYIHLPSPYRATANTHQQLTISVPIVGQLDLIPLTRIPVDTSTCIAGIHVHASLSMLLCMLYEVVVHVI